MGNISIIPVADIPKAQPCPTDNLQSLLKLCLEMADLCEKEQGIGLAAVQVGVPWRLFIVKIGDRYRYFLNCSYQSNENRMPSIEGCLSIRTPTKGLRYFQLDRYPEVEVSGFELVTEPTLAVVPVKELFSEEVGVCFQHEIDHCFDVLISDLGYELVIW